MRRDTENDGRLWSEGKMQRRRRWRVPDPGEVEMMQNNRPERKAIGSRWIFNTAHVGYSWETVGPATIIAYPKPEMEKFGRYVVQHDGATIRLFATDSSLSPLVEPSTDATTRESASL